MIEIRLTGSVAGVEPVLARLTVEPNGAWEEWFELEAQLDESVRQDLPKDALDVELRFWNEERPSALMNLDRLDVLLDE